MQMKWLMGHANVKGMCYRGYIVLPIDSSVSLPCCEHFRQSKIGDIAQCFSISIKVFILDGHEPVFGSTGCCNATCPASEKKQWNGLPCCLLNRLEEVVDNGDLLAPHYVQLTLVNVARQLMYMSYIHYFKIVVDDSLVREFGNILKDLSLLHYVTLISVMSVVEELARDEALEESSTWGSHYQVVESCRGVEWEQRCVKGQGQE